MKKICYVTTLPYAIEVFILKSAEYIYEKEGWDISFICDKDNDFGDTLPSHFHYFPISIKRGMSITGIISTYKMYKVFKKENFDLVQYSTPNASLYAAIAARIARIPVRLYCQWGIVYFSYIGIRRQVLKLVEKLVCRLSTWIEPDSKSNLQFSHKERLYPPNKGSVIFYGSACGVDFTKFNISKKREYRKKIREFHQIPENAFVFGFVGRITRDKGINELFEASEAILSKDRNIYLLLVGRIEKEEMLDKTLYKWSKTNQKVVYVGFSTKVEEYLSAMDCYVLPSYREGFGMSVIEAEAMGVPVIVTNIPGPVDAMVRERTGLVIEKKSVESLANAMRTLSQNTQLCQAYSVAALSYAVENFDQIKLFELILQDRKRMLNVF
jgi:glycosyltransferase involved in cell wall biosynthesis